MGTQIASKAHRDGVAERGADPAVHTSLAVDRARIGSDEALRRDVARSLVPTATPPDANTRSLRHTVPGLGTSLRLVRRDDRHAIERFPRGQECASAWRLVTCARASAGTRSGTAGHTIGNAHRTWAVSDAAV
jgi:hypothetical protein